jgi:hypothetical protein
VELRARAGRFGQDRRAVGVEPLGPVDDEVQVLPPGGEDLLVHQRVARVGRQRVEPGVLRRQRRQDPNHDHVRADSAGLGLGRVQTAAHLLLELLQPALEQAPRRDVDLDVELPELGDEVRVTDRLERRSVLERRLERFVDEVELDLQAHHGFLEVELRLGEHPGEHVQAAVHLLAVALPVLAGEDPVLDVLAHRTSSSVAARARAWRTCAADATGARRWHGARLAQRLPRGPGRVLRRGGAA